MSTGFVTAIFPASITIASGHFYIWASEMMDTFASLTLIVLVLIAQLHVRSEPDARVETSDDHTIPNGAEAASTAGTTLEADLETHSAFDRRLGGSHGRARRRPILIAAVIVAAVFAASLFEQVLGGNHFNSSLENSAISLSENSQILPALESTLREIPHNFTSSAYSQYFLASGWASDIGATSTAANLDVLLVRASIVNENPVGLVVGINQYSVEEHRPLSLLAVSENLTAAESRTWLLSIQAAVAWGNSGNASALIHYLRATSKDSPPILAQEFQQAITMVQNYDNAA
jgi:hypothetical protein